MKKTKITQVAKFSHPHIGGIESFIEMLNSCLRTDDKNEIEVLSCSNDVPSSVEKNVKYERCKYLFEFAANTISPSFMRKLSHVNTDILHYHMPFIFAVIAHFIARPKYKKLYISYHSDIIGYDKIIKPFWGIYKNFLNKADIIHIQSPQILESSSLLRQYKDKCVIIPYSIGIDNDYDQIKAESIREKYKNKKILFSLGRHVKYKGFIYAIEAMKNVENAVLLIGGDGPMKEEEQELILKNKLEDKVVLLGRIKDEDLKNYYQACDIFLFPSILRSETFGVVQLEAMCYSKPVINTYLQTGVNYVSVHNETGLSVEPENPQQLAQAVNTLVNNDELRVQLGKNAYKRAKELFNIEKVKYNYLELFSENINAKNSV